MSQKKHLNPEQKVIILRELLENQIPISQLAEKHGIHINDIYNWKKKLFEQAAENIFSITSFQKKSEIRKGQEKQFKLEEIIKQKDEVIAELVRENIF